MFDITQADNLKFKFRLFMYFINKELTKETGKHGLKLQDGQTVFDAINEDMKVCTNPVIRSMYNKMMESTQYMDEKYQAEIIKQFGGVFLWILYRDTAYRDPFFWVISEVIKDPCFQDNLNQYVKSPDMWYCPNWNKSKKITAEKRDVGELTRFELSPTENIFVPKMQAQEWDNILQQVDKKSKSYNKKV